MAEEFKEIKVKDLMENIMRFALEGVMTDGGHHKQYYLEQIIRELSQDKNAIKTLREEFGWEEGIAP